ncbi:uncharacterized protein BJ212DRAFT_1295110 [Suillus subaureus]|uniref:Uncharacterized protein n=1 Tax=Suillus subaureus TaxID=48587 RepID=A0A9P7EN49_9AGAM|nr:uncharacterized protein BJ212DRAFT_1295110 [Suillus subaureus]KAG1825739.1 hypothetical protein BJ212DRAFT_1295110 [Suillus subaureus]
MPCTSSTGSSVASGSTGSFKSLSVSPQLPLTSEAPNSSPLLKSSLRASVSLPPTTEAPSSSPILKGHSFSVRASSPVTPNKHNSVSLPPTSEVLDSSPIVKSHASCLRTGFPVTPVKTRVSTVGSLAPMHEVPASSPIPGSSCPIPSSSPILRGRSPTVNVLPLLPTMSDEGSTTVAHTYSPHKRPHQYSLLLAADGLTDHENFPMKKPRLLLTTICYPHLNMCMLELSCISHQTFATKMEYQRLHAEELELIVSLMKDEMEESQVHVARADLQIGLLWNSLHDAGVAVIWNKGRKDAKKEIGYSRMFPHCGDHEVDDNGDSWDSSVSSGCNGSVDDKLQASGESYYSQAAPLLNP